MVFNATFNNSSAISCRSVLMVEETEVPGQNHRPQCHKSLTSVCDRSSTDNYIHIYDI